MADQIAIAALVRKRAELSGDLIVAEKRIAQLRSDLTSIDGAIRVFDPSIAAAQIRPVIKRKTVPLLPQGQGTRIILDTMRRAGAPLTPREIAERIAAEHGIGTGPGAMERLTQKVRNALARQEGRARHIRSVVLFGDDQGARDRKPAG
jgi:hypothetical protein